MCLSFPLFQNRNAAHQTNHDRRAATARGSVTSGDVTPKPSHVTRQEETPLKGELGCYSDWIYS